MLTEKEIKMKLYRIIEGLKEAKQECNIESYNRLQVLLGAVCYVLEIPLHK